MKVLIPTYTFNAAEGKITVVDYNPIKLEQLLLITNSHKNKIIYNFANPSQGATITDNVISLSANTSDMEDTDALQIFVEEYSTPSTEITLQAVESEIQKSNTLLNVLTGKDVTLSVDVSAINLNTDELEDILVNTNTKLDALTAVDYATSNKQDLTNTLLNVLTAKETTISLDVSAINLNTDEIEGKLDRTNTLLNNLTGNVLDIEGLINTTNDRINTSNTYTNEIRVNTSFLPSLFDYTTFSYNLLGAIETYTFDIRSSLFAGIGGYTLGGYINSYNILLSSIDTTLKNGLDVTGGSDTPVKKIASSNLISSFTAPSANRVYNIFGVSTANVGQYLQIYDIAGSTPSGTPSGIFFVPANSNFNFEFVRGMPFTNNKALIVNSITPVDYNAGNSDLFITVIYN